MYKSPTLYLLIGAPGAGKTSLAKIIAEKTGAAHLWANVERHKLFPQPTHSAEESAELYERLNTAAEYLLSNSKSVIFDTNFNFFSDRQKLRDIASKHGAETVLIWLSTPLQVAKDRALHAGDIRNGYKVTMSAEQFDNIVAKLEPPSKDENFIKIDGTKLDADEVTRLLSL